MPQIISVSGARKAPMPNRYAHISERKSPVTPIKDDATNSPASTITIPLIFLWRPLFFCSSCTFLVLANCGTS